MTDTSNLFGNFAAVVTPFFLGCSCLFFLLRKSPQRNCWIIAGYGYLAGLFLTTLLMRAWDFTGLGLNFWAMSATITVIASCFCVYSRANGYISPGSIYQAPQQKLQVVAALFLFVAILYRYYGIAQEIWLRPLYPWDAWMNWNPKAVVWFHLKELMAFTSPEQWLLQRPQENAIYTTGAASAWKYPPTIPLISLWGMLGVGASDQNYSNLPWLIAPLAFSLALFGHLLRMGAPVLINVLACYALLSLPYLNVHTALAGYADLWLGLAFGLAVMAMHEWRETRYTGWGAIVLFFAFACTQLKLPGLILGSILVAVLLFSAAGVTRKQILVGGAMLTLGMIYIALFGVRLDLPIIGNLELSASMFSLPYLGDYYFNYHSVHKAIFENLFSLANWNIFWYLAATIAIVKFAKLEFTKTPSPELQSIILLLLFLGFTFHFTHIYAYVLDSTLVNRALLYVVPALTFYMFKYIIRSHINRGNPACQKG